MRRALLLITASALLGASSAQAAPAKTRKALPELLAQVEAHYAKSGSISAEFAQDDLSATFGEKKSSQGTLAWKAPDSLRWETKAPEANLLVSNGKTVWVYTPPFDETENGQVIIRKASEVKSRLMDALLAGRFSRALQQGLAIEVLPKKTFALKPKKSAGGNLKQAIVTIGDDQPVIAKVSIEYRDGNKSTIELSSIKMGEPLEKSLFEFKVPPRTDIVKE
jgi:outer membrane lipoprotein carrier protein